MLPLLGNGRLSNSSLCWKGAFFLFISLWIHPIDGVSQASRKAPPSKASAVRTTASTTKLAANQAQINQIKELLKQNNLTEARRLVDEYLNNPQNSKASEFWYLKGKIYAGLTSENASKYLLPDARRESLEAFRRAIDADSNQAVMLLTLDGFQPVYSLYTSGMQQGVELYNAERFEDALRLFKETAMVGSFIFNRGWGLTKLDTTLTLYCALSAQYAKKDAEAITYFKQLADANVATAKEYAVAYRVLARYYYEKDDESNMLRYVNACLSRYPDDDFMPLLMIDYYRDKRELSALYNLFDRLLQKYPDQYDLYIEYARELFAETHVIPPVKHPNEVASKYEKIESLLLKATSLKPSSPDARLSLGMHYYNLILLRDEEMNNIKGMLPEDEKRRSEINQKSITLAEKALVPLEYVFKYYTNTGTLSTGERSNLRTTCSLLTYVYEKLQNKSKADFYQQQFDTFQKSSE